MINLSVCYYLVMTWPVIALFAIVTFWICLVILLTKWPRASNRSISQHAARSRDSFIFFTTAQVVIGFTLYLFVIRWLVPVFRLSILFTVVYTVTAWLQIVSAFIPDKVHGKSSSAHQRLANPFALGMFLVTALLCATPNVTGWTKLALYATLLYMIYGLSLIIPKKGKPHLLKNYLYLQTIYIVSFQFSFLAVILFR